MNVSEDQIIQNFAELGARASLALGFPRSLGQIYAALYLSPEPLGLEELTKQLGISKGSVSMSVRQLEQLGLVRQIWQKGSRRDYYEASDDFRAILTRLLQNVLKPKLESAGALLDQLETDLTTTKGDPASASFRKNRIRKLKNLRKKISSLLPLAEGLLK